MQIEYIKIDGLKPVFSEYIGKRCEDSEIRVKTKTYLQLYSYNDNKISDVAVFGMSHDKEAH